MNWFLLIPYALIGFGFMCLFSFFQGRHAKTCPFAFGSHCGLHIGCEISAYMSLFVWPLVVGMWAAFGAVMAVMWPLMWLQERTATYFKGLGSRSAKTH